MLKTIHAVILYCPLLLLCACAAGGQPSSPAPTAVNDGTVIRTAAQRADPGYIQYLERQSLFGTESEAARIVSGSQLAWQRPAADPSPDALLYLANSWLSVHPLAFLTEPKRPVFSSLSNPLFWQIMSKIQMNGLYLSPTSGAGSIWAYNRQPDLTGEDVVQYGFSESAGGEGDYRRLLQAANANRSLLGLDLTPLATGMGPDFFLAVRNLRGYPGLYCLIEIPQKLWPALPGSSDQWSGIALSAAQIQALADAQILPPTVSQNSLAFISHAAKQSGWAATSEVHGIDGIARRWVYRYFARPDRPILNWEDPSASARRVLSASAIQNVGMQGGALIGLRLDGLYGLEASGGALRQDNINAIEPAQSAAVSISREVRRYGGWIWLKDELPLDYMQQFLQQGPDFISDTVFSPAAEHALLTGDPTLLRVMADEMIRRGIDGRRLVHSMPGHEGISYSLPHLKHIASLAGSLPEGKGTPSTGALGPAEARNLQQSVFLSMQNTVLKANMESRKGKTLTKDTVPLVGDILYTTPVGLAALALGAGTADTITKELYSTVEQGHLLLTFFKAMQPGLFMASGQDISGVMPLSWHSMRERVEEWDPQLTSRGAYSLLEGNASVSVTKNGISRAKALYPAADVQVQDSKSFAMKLSTILSLRKLYDVARGQIHGRFLTKGSGTFAMAVLLPPSGPASATQAKAAYHTTQTMLNNRIFAAQSGPGDTKGAVRAAALAQREVETRAALNSKFITLPPGKEPFAHGNAALITVYNFARETQTETIDLRATPRLAHLLTLGSPTLFSEGSTINAQVNGSTITITLAPWQAVGILIGEGER